MTSACKKAATYTDLTSLHLVARALVAARAGALVAGGHISARALVVAGATAGGSGGTCCSGKYDSQLHRFQGNCTMLLRADSSHYFMKKTWHQVHVAKGGFITPQRHTNYFLLNSIEGQGTASERGRSLGTHNSR